MMITKKKKEKISIYQYNTIQHNSFGIGFDSWLLGPRGLAAVFCEMAHFLAVVADLIAMLALCFRVSIETSTA